jgi:hypothetical protein
MDNNDGQLMMSLSLECMANANYIVLVGVKMCYFHVPRDTHADSSLLGVLKAVHVGNVPASPYGQKAPKKRAIWVIFAGNKPDPNGVIGGMPPPDQGQGYV